MPYCITCGAEMAEAAAFCQNCGAKAGVVAPTASKNAKDGTVDVRVQDDADEGFPKKYLVWAVVVGVSLVIIYFISAAVAPVEDVTVELNYPERVLSGEQFALTVTLTNLIDTEQELDSIDIGNTYLAGVRILSATPPFSETFDVLDGTRSHTFETGIPASGELAVVFEATARVPGRYEGAFDICINGPASCVFETISLTVE